MKNSIFVGEASLVAAAERAFAKFDNDMRVEIIASGQMIQVIHINDILEKNVKQYGNLEAYTCFARQRKLLQLVGGTEAKFYPTVVVGYTMMDMNENCIDNTFCHEFVHVHQLVTERLKVTYTNTDIKKYWNGQLVVSYPINSTERHLGEIGSPWENEAYGLYPVKMSFMEKLKKMGLLIKVEFNHRNNFEFNILGLKYEHVAFTE